MTEVQLDQQNNSIDQQVDSINTQLSLPMLPRPRCKWYLCTSIPVKFDNGYCYRHQESKSTSQSLEHEVRDKDLNRAIEILYVNLKQRCDVVELNQ